MSTERRQRQLRLRPKLVARNSAFDLPVFAMNGNFADIFFDCVLSRKGNGLVPRAPFADCGSVILLDHPFAGQLLYP
ncbi:MAG: hypothetical protein WDN28_18900 [Chthoniobacter sp.]